METTNTSKDALDTRFFGHPAGLSTLFFTEMWERMSYYGMRILLVVFMTKLLQEGNLFLSGEDAEAEAKAIYGLYTGMVYFMGLPGGWLSDRLFGAQKSVWYGGIIIMLGHIVLAIPSNDTFFIGLILVVLGTGLLKPNITALVGQLYSDEDTRRDAGYSLYYMGINMGSIGGYIITGYLSESIGYHWAFGAAAVGMGLGLLQYHFTRGNLGNVGSEPTQPLSLRAKKMTYAVITAFLITLAVVTGLILVGILAFDAKIVVDYVAKTFAVIFLFFYLLIYFGGNLNNNEKKRLGALFLICIASACFWAGFEQAGTSLNLFAKNNTDRLIGSFEIPYAWFGSLNSLFIIILSPFFAALWIKAGQSMIGRSYGIKAAIGLVIMASGFIVMFFAAQYAASGLKVAPYWLVATYFLHTVGELCLSPVALSAVSKLSPKRFSGQMMGLFVLTYSIGNLIAGLLASNFGADSNAELFKQIATFSIGIGIVLFLVSFRTSIWEHAGEEDKK